MRPESEVQEAFWALIADSRAGRLVLTRCLDSIVKFPTTLLVTFQ